MSETIVVPDNGNNSMNNAWPWLAMNNGGWGNNGWSNSNANGAAALEAQANASYLT